MLAHKGVHEAHVAAEVIAGKKNTILNQKLFHQSHILSQKLLGLV